MLFQASMPARYWGEALHTATYLLNHLPCKAISISCLFVALDSVAPSYEHLCVFSCVCYPNLSAQTAHKLAPRSTRCVFLRYFTDHKGYQCLDLSTNNTVVSRHVVFDETVFPFAASPHLTNDLDIFLQDDALGVVPQPAPLPTPRVPLVFSPLAATGGQTMLPGYLTVLGIEAGGLTATPSGQTIHGIEADGLIAHPYVTLLSPASPTSVTPNTLPSTSTAPLMAPTTPSVPRAAPTSTTPPAPPVV
jgi:hypothetical protein